MEERWTGIDGLRVRYLEEGAGPALVLLHGASLGSSADVWSQNLTPLAARGLRVIAPDLPGFGLTDNPGDGSLAYRMRFVPALLDALGVDRAHVVGHSQAGRIAVMLGIERPERLLRIVVLATGGLLPPLPGAAAAGDGEEGGSSEPTVDDARALLEDNLFDHSLITPDALVLRHRMSLGKNFQAFAARRLAKQAQKATKEKDAAPLWQRLREVRVPLRMIYGREDRGHTLERVAIAQELHPGLDIHLVERARHLVQWDAPGEFERLAGDFLLA